MASPQHRKFFGRLKRDLMPLLGEAGFEGEKFEFTRVVNEVIQALTLHTRRGDCWIQLGVHPVLLPYGSLSDFGDDIDWAPIAEPRSFRQSHCEFWWRLPKPGPGARDWHYGTAAPIGTNPEACADDLIRTVRGVALRDFEQYSTVEAIAARTSLEAVRGGTYPWGTTQTRTAIAMARIELSRGNRGPAHEFSKVALEHLGNGGALEPTIRRLLQETA